MLRSQVLGKLRDDVRLQLRWITAQRGQGRDAVQLVDAHELGARIPESLDDPRQCDLVPMRPGVEQRDRVVARVQEALDDRVLELLDRTMELPVPRPAVQPTCW